MTDWETFNKDGISCFVIINELVNTSIGFPPV